MKNIDNIINEAIDRLIENRSLISEDSIGDIKQLLADYQKKLHKTPYDIKQEKKLKKKLAKKQRPNIKKRKTVGGGEEDYDYDEYMKHHKKTTKADSDAIIDMIDMDNTDIAAVARDVFSDHTDEGAQSHLRKVLERERPMSDDVARKLQRMISDGSVAVKH